MSRTGGWGARAWSWGHCATWSSPPGTNIWSHILRDQLDVDEAAFWACARDGVKPDRGGPPFWAGPRLDGYPEGRDQALAQMCTIGQVSVLVIPGTPWIWAPTSLPRSSTLSASARPITSWGPVTSSAWFTPLL